MKSTDQHICLNMIVKNESRVITRCLSSVIPFIKSWAIVDTGSTDGTQGIIKEYLKNIPGQLIERPWVDFAHNRTEALQYVNREAEYILIVDADEEIKTDPGFDFPTLVYDGYYLQSRLSTINYYRMQLVKNGLNWCWQSKLHEYITSNQMKTYGYLESIYDLPHPDGHRSSNPNKYKQDALTLEQALLEEPENERYTFYLAQSYRDCRDTDLAIRYYTKRVTMAGWAEEVWYSLYQIGVLKLNSGTNWEEVQMALLDAYNYRPTRAEPLIPIIKYYLNKEAWPLALLFAKQASEIPTPKDLLFIEPEVYGAKKWLLYARAAYGCGHYDKAMAACSIAINTPLLKAEVLQEAITLRASAQDLVFNVSQLEVSDSKKINVIVICNDFSDAFDNCINSILEQSFRNYNVTCLVPKQLLEKVTKLLSDIENKPFQVQVISKLMSVLNTLGKNETCIVLQANVWFNHNNVFGTVNQLLQNELKVIHGSYLYQNGLYGINTPDIFFTQLETVETCKIADHWMAFNTSLIDHLALTTVTDFNTLSRHILQICNSHELQSYFLEKPMVTI